ncbi:MAG: DUF3303 domain-containing protein [Acidimicrobiales bacterium]
MAKYVLSWTLRQVGTAQQNHEDAKTLLAAFAKWQPPADQNWLQFLQRVDGRGGVAVLETDNPAGILGEVSKFETWNEFDLVPVIDITESIPLAAAGVEFRESV